jgi:hypothetical protein
LAVGTLRQRRHVFGRKLVQRIWQAAGFAFVAGQRIDNGAAASFCCPLVYRSNPTYAQTSITASTTIAIIRAEPAANFNGFNSLIILSLIVESSRLRKLSADSAFPPRVCAWSR